jgi:NADPH2:quinone reductase
MSEKMKAIVVRDYGPPDVMQVEDVERPVPKGTEVLVRVGAAGVNPVDTYLRSGIHAHAPKLPYTPGKDAGGTVEAVGEAVTNFVPGDRVYTAGAITGTYAEFALCDERQLGGLPDNISFGQGAGVWTPYATSFRALFQKAGLQAGETVLIHGASGGVGLACLQWARSAGARVFGTASSEDGLELARSNGAERVFDHSDGDHYGEIREATDGRGVDVIIEMLANENLERDFEFLGMNGRIVVVGNRGTIEFTPRLAMTNETTIYGMSLFNAAPSDLQTIHSAITSGLANGTLDPVVAKEFPLNEAPAAHTSIIEDKATGKIVLVPAAD